VLWELSGEHVGAVCALRKLPDLWKRVTMCVFIEEGRGGGGVREGGGMEGGGMEGGGREGGGREGQCYRDRARAYVFEMMTEEVCA